MHPRRLSVPDHVGSAALKLWARLTPTEEEPSPRLMRPWYDGTMLVATVLAAVVTAATFTLQFHLLLRAFLKTLAA